MVAYDAIVLGTGAVGSAALNALARRGARVLGLDRFPPAHDRGSSHGRTRMIRQAYFEHPDYVPMAIAAFDEWETLAARREVALYRQTGLLEVGPADGVVVPGVLASAIQHDLPVESLDAAEIERRFPGLRTHEGQVGVFEQRAGYLRVETCIRTLLDEARQHGAELRTNLPVVGWKAEGANITVRTADETYSAARLIVAAGAWSATLLPDLELPLTVRRSPQYWFATDSPDYRVENATPAFLYETPDGVYYGFPQIDDSGVKMAEHGSGELVADPLALDREIDSANLARVVAFAMKYAPAVTDRCTHHAACMYTMTPDEHFIVDRHPRHEQVVFAAGLSGHGFKFTPVLGRALVELAMEGQTALPIGFLGLARFGQRPV